MFQVIVVQYRARKRHVRLEAGTMVAVAGYLTVRDTVGWKFDQKD